MDSDSILSIRNLTVQYGGFTAVENANLEVKRGCIVGIVGESGSGKSTLISAVIGLLSSSATITSGEILFDGKDLAKMGDPEFTELRGLRISMVSQDPLSALNPVLTIGQHLMDIQYRDAISNKEKYNRAVEALKSVFMPNPEARMSMYPHELSGGQKQRVSIAMAVMMKPDILIADEATTALDATLELEIINLLKDLQQEISCAMIFVTHHLGTVSSLCNDVIVMYNGQVVENGSVKDVFRSPTAEYTRNLLRCDPAQIEEKCRRLPTMNAPETKSIETADAAEQRIVGDEPPILEIADLEVEFRKPLSLSELIRFHKRESIKAVDKVSLSLRRGETVAIVGESGSGKTTLIRSILNLVTIRSGRIRFAGVSSVDADRGSLANLRKDIALIFQDPVGSLSPRMTVGAIIREVLELIMDEPAHPDQEVRRLLKLVGLPTDFILRYPHELSGGQARRVCVARALAQSPKLIVADEPTAGLDVSIQGEILNLLAELQEQLQLPILVVTHNLNVVRHISDRIIIMNMGRVVESGQTEEIFADPKHDYTRRLLEANHHPLP